LAYLKEIFSPEHEGILSKDELEDQFDLEEGNGEKKKNMGR